MIKLIFCLTRRNDVPFEEFYRIWRDEHGPLVVSFAATLGIRRYVQVHTIEPQANVLLAESRGAPAPFDGIAELWFDDREALDAAATSPDGRAAGAVLAEDERRFIDHAHSPIFLAEEHAFIA